MFNRFRRNSQPSQPSPEVTVVDSLASYHMGREVAQSVIQEINTVGRGQYEFLMGYMHSICTSEISPFSRGLCSEILKYIDGISGLKSGSVTFNCIPTYSVEEV